MKLLYKINEFIKNCSGVFLAIMTGLVLLQVFFRYALKYPLTGSEELARYAMIWCVMLGSTIAIKNKSHVAVGLIVDMLPKTLKKIVILMGNIFIILFALIMLVKGWDLTIRSMSQSSPATHIPVGYISAAIPVSGLLTILYTIENLIKSISNENDIDKSEEEI